MDGAAKPNRAAWLVSGAGRERRKRALPLLAFAVIGFAAGVLAGAGHHHGERDIAAHFTRAWERGDYAEMYSLTSERTQRTTPLLTFARAYREAAATATTIALRAGKPGRFHDRSVDVPIHLRTRVFGSTSGTLQLRFDGQGDGARIDWSPQLVFPGLGPGELLERHTELPPRAAILAREGTPLAQGPERSSPLAAAAREIAGTLGPAPADRAGRLRVAGYPDDAEVGVSGLERVFERELAGAPGGELLAGGRVVARAPPRRGRAVRTSIDPKIQEAATSALGGRLGGIAVLRPADGQILALAGIAFSAPQPPGSTFKIVTLAAALAGRVARPETQFSYASSAVLSGVQLQNAHGESCGGTLVQAFAQSCNSVFAPLGVKVGARRLVAAAERFGFNRAPGIPGAATSTIPAADSIGDDLALGSTAIGQGRVLATPLSMAAIAAAIGEHGLLPRPTLRSGERAQRRRATSRRVAATVGRMMLEVVRSGTGTTAALPGIDVAGKTGTAELESTVKPPDANQQTPLGRADNPTDTDAWFVAYAPASRPRFAIAVMLVRAGAGRDTAAPVARSVLFEALQR